jgi:hypothetical protein
MNERVNPFGDLGDFAPAPPKPKAEILDVVDQVAAANGFPSRQAVKQPAPQAWPAPAAPLALEQQQAAQVKPKKPKEQLPSLPSRRRTTGRSEQVNIKTTFEAKKRLMEISVERDMPLGEVLELALAALEKLWAEGS